MVFFRHNSSIVHNSYFMLESNSVGEDEQIFCQECLNVQEYGWMQFAESNQQMGKENDAENDILAVKNELRRYKN